MKKTQEARIAQAAAVTEAMAAYNRNPNDLTWQAVNDAVAAMNEATS